jgi:hypothetical protein
LSVVGVVVRHIDLSPRFLYCRLVGKDNNGRTSFFYESQSGRGGPVFEETPTVPQDERIDHEPVLVDEVVPHLRVHKFATAVDQDVLTGLLLQPKDFLRDIPFDQA